MQAIVLAGLQVAAEALKLINHEVANKYQDRLVSLQLELLDEESKGQLSDDLKVQRLYRESAIILEAVRQELRVANAKSP